MLCFHVCFWDDERAASGADDVGGAELAAAEAGDGVAVRRRLGSCTYTSLSRSIPIHTTLQFDWTLPYHCRDHIERDIANAIG